MSQSPYSVIKAFDNTSAPSQDDAICQIKALDALTPSEQDHFVIGAINQCQDAEFHNIPKNVCKHLFGNLAEALDEIQKIDGGLGMVLRNCFVVLRMDLG